MTQARIRQRTLGSPPRPCGLVSSMPRLIISQLRSISHRSCSGAGPWGGGPPLPKAAAPYQSGLRSRRVDGRARPVCWERVVLSIAGLRSGAKRVSNISQSSS